MTSYWRFYAAWWVELPVYFGKNYPFSGEWDLPKVLQPPACLLEKSKEFADQGYFRTGKDGLYCRFQ